MASHWVSSTRASKWWSICAAIGRAVALSIASAVWHRRREPRSTAGSAEHSPGRWRATARFQRSQSAGGGNASGHSLKGQKSITTIIFNSCRSGVRHQLADRSAAHRSRSGCSDASSWSRAHDTTTTDARRQKGMFLFRSAHACDDKHEVPNAHSQTFPCRHSYTPWM